MDTYLETLSSKSCVLKAYFPNVKQESSACGTVIDPSRGLVISHGSVLTDCCVENELSAKIRGGKVLLPKDLSGSNFRALLSNDLFTQELVNQTSLVTIGTSSIANETGIGDHYQSTSPGFTQVKCQFVCAFRNSDFHKTLNNLMPRATWTFNEVVTDNETSNATNNVNNHQQDTHEDLDKDELNDLSYQLLSYFLLFKLDYGSMSGSHKSLRLKAQSPLKSRRGRCFTGETAEIVATPFASLCPGVFFNGYSRGVVSNVGGINDCWIVTDARCIPGCEGGPLYTKRKPTDSPSYLTGIITSPLCWKNNEWVGFSVACSIDSILTSMAQHPEILPNPSSRYAPSIRKQNSPLLKDLTKVQAMTVLVQCGNTWGTGVIIDRDMGVILTCSHVVKGAGPDSVTVTPTKSTSQYKAQVVYRQQPVKTAYDLAVIRCPKATKHMPKGWRVTVANACVGEDIVLCGHAVFDTVSRLGPSVCQGVVSKVIRKQEQPVMVQTTCAVHAGSSGGPLLTLDCRLVGIVVCNTRDSMSNTSFPHVNLCIPISTVFPAISSYLSNGDKKGLSQLQVQDVELNQLWALGAQTSHGAENGYQKSKL